MIGLDHNKCAFGAETGLAITAEYTANNPAETQTIGECLGRHAQPGDTICLIGDLGSGKTTLTQGIGRGLAIPERDISSPTFALVAEHRVGRIPLYHFDVYRLTGPSDLYDLGFEDYSRELDGLIVIEWANIVFEALPDDCLVLNFSPGPDPDSRILEFSALGPKSALLLKAIQ